MGFLTFSKEDFTFENMKVAYSEMQVHTLDMTQRKSKAAHAARIQFFLAIHCIGALASRKREVPKRKYTILRDDPSGGFTMKLSYFLIRD